MLRHMQHLTKPQRGPLELPKFNIETNGARLIVSNTSCDIMRTGYINFDLCGDVRVLLAFDFYR